MKDYSILVITSDRYISLLVGFLKLLNFHWQGTLPRTYIVGETQSIIPYEAIDDVEYLLAGKTNWSNQVYFALQKITTSYVILMLEDLFIMDFVDPNKINLIYDYAINRDLDYINLLDSSEHIELDFKCHEVKDSYLIGAGKVMWKRESLMNFLRKNESAWDFESMGAFRSKFLKLKTAEVLGKGLFNVEPDGVIIKGKLNPRIDFHELDKKFGIKFIWNDVDVSKIVLTYDVPRYLRAIRIVLRTIKTLINVYFNRFKQHKSIRHIN